MHQARSPQQVEQLRFVMTLRIEGECMLIVARKQNPVHMPITCRIEHYWYYDNPLTYRLDH